MNLKLENSSDYKYYSFDKENSILYHEISEKNCGTADAFVLSMSYFMTLMEKFEPENLIIKIWKPPDYFEFELKSFMQSTFYKLVKDLKIKKVAFYIFHQIYIPGLKKYEKDTPLMVRFFPDLEEAKQWVLKSD